MGAIPHKLRTYVKYKIQYKTEDYIRMPMGRIHHAILAQFRSGIIVELKLDVGKNDEYRGQGMHGVRRKYC